jgi:hypothetical protein
MMQRKRGGHTDGQRHRQSPVSKGIHTEKERQIRRYRERECETKTEIDTEYERGIERR